MNRLFLTIPLLVVTACGGDKSPSAPSSTTTAVAVTVPSPVRMGQTTQATGTETLSNGQARPITTGWLSDAPAVATVTDSGIVSGVANGRATIYVVASGRQGQQVVRVVPDYQGNWSGVLRVASCSQTGAFVDVQFCDELSVGSMYRYGLNVSQAGEQLTVVVDYGTPLVFPSVAASIREDGTSAFTATTSLTDSGVTLTIDSAFTINSTRVGQLAGAVNELWRFPNVSGEGRVVYDIVSTTRGTTASSAGGASTRPMNLLRQLALRRH